MNKPAEATVREKSVLMLSGETLFVVEGKSRLSFWRGTEGGSREFLLEVDTNGKQPLICDSSIGFDTKYFEEIAKLLEGNDDAGLKKDSQTLKSALSYYASLIDGGKIGEKVRKISERQFLDETSTALENLVVREAETNKLLARLSSGKLDRSK